MTTSPEADPFSLLGLPRAFRLEPGALERAVRDQARAWHPDRFARAEPRDRRLALERSTAVNDARRRLERWPSRAACLLSLAGHPPADRAQAADDPAFLESQLELREALESARAAGDAGALERLGAEIRARLAALEGEAARLFDDPGWPVAHAGALARVVARARFLEAVLADADRARSVGG